MSLAPHQQRVVDELEALQSNISKLHVFIGGEVFKTLSAIDQALLTQQIVAMKSYATILTLRTERF